MDFVNQINYNNSTSQPSPMSHNSEHETNEYKNFFANSLHRRSSSNDFLQPMSPGAASFVPNQSQGQGYTGFGTNSAASDLNDSFSNLNLSTGGNGNFASFNNNGSGLVPSNGNYYQKPHSSFFKTENSPTSSSSSKASPLFNSFSGASTNTNTSSFFLKSSSTLPTANGSNSSNNTNFHLPMDLQGGVSNINLRRPSYTAEMSSNSYNHNSGPGSVAGNIQESPIQLAPQLSNFVDTAFVPMSSYPMQVPKTAPLNGSFFDMHSPISSSGSSSNYKLSSYLKQPQTAIGTSFNIETNNAAKPQFRKKNSTGNLNNAGSAGSGSTGSSGSIELDNGLILVNNHIVSSAHLRKLYNLANRYFCIETATKIYESLKLLLNPNTNPNVSKINDLINFLKTKNDINNSNYLSKYKSIALVCSKSGKIDVLTVSNNSNILLQRNDLVIVEGDRGKDLVCIVEPNVGLNFVVLLNFLKKREHLKSMGIFSNKSNSSNSSNHNGNGNSSYYVQDDENIISLPTKQILRFASAKEVNEIPAKFKNELIAFKIAIDKLKQINMKNSMMKNESHVLNLKIFNCEFQFDNKKLIFYYSCNKRNDFRELIKELFKIYKTRIWLCAVLNPDEFDPYNKMNVMSRGFLLDNMKYYNNDYNDNDDSAIRSDKYRATTSNDNDKKKDNEEILKAKYNDRIKKILDIDENNFEFDSVEVDGFQSENLMNSINNLKIDLGLTL